jgi:hypothetical protein
MHSMLSCASSATPELALKSVSSMTIPEPVIDGYQIIGTVYLGQAEGDQGLC